MMNSNILKIPALLGAAGLAVVLVLGFALNATLVFAKGPPTCKPKDCDPDPVAEYSVVFSGDLTGMSVTPWVGSKTIGLLRGSEKVGFLNSGNFFFIAGPASKPCFDLGTSMDEITLAGGKVSKGKRGIATSRLRFDGWTKDGEKNGVAVDYLLKLDGKFMSGDWPPTAVTIMQMATWVLGVENASGEVRDNSCIGEGFLIDPVTGDMIHDVEITVTLN
jgi:hypothetical protein